MKKKDNHLGFTMIEILAVIVILGILSVMGVMTVRGVISRAEQSHYKEQESYITLTGKEYFSDYRSKLPKTVGPVSEVTLKTLIDEKYIKEVLDYQRNACDYNGSKVKVQKQGENEYAYSTYLKCNNYDSSEDGTAPSIKFTPNSKKTNQDIVVTMGISDDNQVKYYSYVIYKDGEAITTVTKRAYNQVIKIRLSAEGRYKIVGTAWDNEELVTIKESGEYLIDKTPPDCNAIQISSDQTKEKWTYNDVNLTLKFPNDVVTWDWYTNTDGGRYFKQSENIPGITKKTLSSTGKRRGQIILYDEAGNSCKRTTDSYYIDKTVPTIRLSGSVASGALTNQDVTLTATPTPGTTPSGYTYTFELKQGNSWVQVQQSTNNKFVVKNEGTGTYQVRVKTGAGREASSNTYVVYIDKTPPQRPTITNPTNGNWTNSNFSLTGTSSDSGSGISYWQYRYDSNTTWVTYSNSAMDRFTTTPYSAERNENTYLRACDKAGNCSPEASTPIRIDKTAPNKPTITNPTNGNWTNSNFSLTGNSSDSGSGISYWQYRYDSNTTWVTYSNSAMNKFVTTPYSAERNENTYLRTCDRAGNCSQETSTPIRIDKTAPNKPTLTNPSNGNWTKNSFSLTGRSGDSGSGISYWQYRYANVSWVTYSDSAKNTFVTTPYSAQRDENTYLRACDRAGNCSQETSTRIRIDKTAPVIHYALTSGGTLDSGVYKSPGSALGNETYRGTISIRIWCTDAGGSGIISNPYLGGDYSEKIEAPKQNRGLAFECVDNAGNSTWDTRNVNVKTYGQSSACGKSYPCGWSDCKTGSSNACVGGYVTSNRDFTVGDEGGCSSKNGKTTTVGGKKYRYRGCNTGGAHQCVCHTDVWDSCASTKNTCQGGNTSTCYPECWHY